MEEMRVLVLSTYPPTRCGLATFSRDLVASMEEAGESATVRIDVAAIDREGVHAARRGRVVWTVDPDRPEDYDALADDVNASAYDVVLLQHEYGLFGGDWGDHLLRFLLRCEKPIVTVCHTVMEDPEPKAVAVLQQVARYSAAMVVMAGAAVDLLRRYYRIRGQNVVVIPHGVPQFRFGHVPTLKERMGLLGRPVISTFGLVGRGKGLEFMIKAMRHVLRERPDAVYLIIGQTHPSVLAWEGEAYRKELQELAASLPQPDAVRFVNRFVRQQEIGEYLQISDVYVTPYLGYNQITSGTLSFALAAGKAVVSTPYIHAAESLADGRGILVPFRDEHALAQAVGQLLANRPLREAIEARAYRAAQDWSWPAVGRRYAHLLAAAADGSLQSFLAELASRDTREYARNLPGEMGGRRGRSADGAFRNG